MSRCPQTGRTSYGGTADLKGKKSAALSVARLCMRLCGLEHTRMQRVDDANSLRRPIMEAGL